METACTMKKSESAPVLHVAGSDVKGDEIVRPSSAPVTGDEVKAAIDKWSHLVPNDESKKKVDALIPQVLKGRQKMEQLVALICSPSNSSKLANYAHMVFVMVFPDCCDEQRNKFGGMLASIASDRSGGGGTQEDLYWSEYDSGGYDPCPLWDDESSSW